jgi:hypothetical protein
MGRPKERLPVVYNFFRQHPDKFNEFFEQKNSKAYDSFIEFYEDIFAEHYDNPDLRFGQHLYNKGIVKDIQYNTEEVYWLIEKNYLPAENLLIWCSYGVNGIEDQKIWAANKPKLNSPIQDYEKILGYEGLKNYEVYARRYRIWMNNAPKTICKPYRKLEPAHIKAILATQTLTDLQRATFEKLIKQSPPPDEIVQIKSVSVDCE